MLSFTNDYCEGAHPEILKKLVEINYEKVPGYGFDQYCDSAKTKIRQIINCPNADIWFLTGGTQTNQIAIDTMIKPYEGVIAANTSHIQTHEAGAIESTGHRVITLPEHNGKLDAAEVDKYISDYYQDGNWEHMTIPGMVYITHPTELGTLYTLDELKSLSAVCHKHHIPLYLDGARLGTGLAAKNDVTPADIAKFTDAFYIGGTKCGALFGEALVFTKKNMPEHFLTQVKRHGALLAKGWLVGVQYDVLFTGDLYIRLGKNAVECANIIRETLKEKGYTLFSENPTNQVFVVIENKAMEELAEKVNFYFWEKYDDDHTVIRFVTSWATKMEDVQALCDLL